MDFKNTHERNAIEKIPEIITTYDIFVSIALKSLALGFRLFEIRF